MTTPATSALDNRRAKSSAANAAAEKARAGVTELDHRLQTNANLIEQQAQELRHAESEAKRLKRALKAADTERARLTKQRAKAAARASKAQAKAEAAEAKYDQVVLTELVKREKARDRAEATAGPATSAPAEGRPTPATSAKGTATANTPAKDTATANTPAKDTATANTPAKDTATANTLAKDTAAAKTAAKGANTPAKGTTARRQASPRAGGAVADPPPEQPDPGTAEAVKTAARRTRRAAR